LRSNTVASGEQRREQWEKRVAHWRASGLSMLAYCRRHERSYTSLVRWRRRLEGGSATAHMLTLIPVVASLPNRCPIVIRLPNGVGIEVADGFDAA
jgi:hypothetical protein